MENHYSTREGETSMKKRSFLKTFTLFVAALILPLLLLGTVSVILTQTYLRTTIDQNNRLVLNQIKFNLELILNQINQLSLNYDINSTVGHQLDIGLQSTASTYSSNNALNVIQRFSQAESLSRPYIHSIYIYFDSAANRFFSSEKGITNLNEAIDSGWYTGYRNQDPSVSLWSELRDVRRYSFERPTRVITIYRRTFSRQGVIVLNLLPDYIESQPYFDQPVGIQSPYIVILNESNDVILQSSELPPQISIDFSRLSKSISDSFSIVANGNPYIINKVESDAYGWKYISIVPQSALYNLPSQITFTMCWIFGICLLLGLFLAYRISRRNFNQLNNIAELLNAAEQGKPLPAITSSRWKDEYTYITDNLIKTFVEQQYTRVALSEKIFRFKTLELLALQSQINPHFLFNTLKTIYWKSYNLTGGPNDVSSMIESLSDLLSYSLGEPQDMVSVQAEIRQTRNYLDIQKIRFQDKFNVIWQVEDSALEKKIIKLILQPIVENSIYHGIMDKEKKSCIRIKIEMCGDMLRFTVTDNGLGMPRDILEKLRKRLSRNSNPQQEIRHIGLYNTAKRVAIKYGDRACVIVRSKYNWGTSVVIAIPADKFPDAPDEVPVPENGGDS